MNVMFQVENYFVRVRDKAGRLKLTVWDNAGTKIVSEFVSAGSLPNLWEHVGKVSSQEVVDKVKEVVQAN